MGSSSVGYGTASRWSTSATDVSRSADRSAEQRRRMPLMRRRGPRKVSAFADLEARAVRPIGGQRPVPIKLDRPAALVDQAMVPLAEWHEVCEIGWPAGEPVGDVMDAAPREARLATRKRAGGVHRAQCRTLCPGRESTRMADVQRDSRAIEDDRQHAVVAAQPADRLGRDNGTGGRLQTPRSWRPRTSVSKSIVTRTSPRVVGAPAPSRATSEPSASAASRSRSVSSSTPPSARRVATSESIAAKIRAPSSGWNRPESRCMPDAVSTR